MIISRGQAQEPLSLEAQRHKEKKQAMKRRAVMMRRLIMTRSTSSQIVCCCDKVMLSCGKRNRLDLFPMRRRFQCGASPFPGCVKDKHCYDYFISLLPATDKQALNDVQYHNMHKCVNVFRCYDSEEKKINAI